MLRGDARGRAVRSAAIAAAALLVLSWISAARAEAQAHVPSDDDRYTLATGCFALVSELTDDYVAKDGLLGYTATETEANAEKFRMQATDLGRYLFYGPTPDFMAITIPHPVGTVGPATTPSDDSDWTVSEDGSAFRIVNEFVDRDLVVAAGPVPVAGTLTTVAEGAGGAAGLFTFEETTGCADYPEIEVNVSGPLPPTQAPNAEVRGLVETHMHQMAFRFLGSKAHCGQPWHRFGARFALVDCPDHGDTNVPATEGCAAVLEAAISGSVCHDTGGWPTFAGWPHHQQLTHEQSYYKWLERSWRGGLRIFVNLLVENRVLCEIYPLTPPGHSCNEMDTVRQEAQDMRDLERYIDAQNGGPGEGWYRIVESPEEARHAINDGKLAVVMGMEVSEPFGCRLMQPGDVPLCTEQGVDAGLDEIYDLGVRQLELVNKFDNALTGVAGDSGTTGTITNLGNLNSAGTFWDYEHCDDTVNNDNSPEAIEHNDDELIANGLDAFGDTTGITFPVYGPPPHCNQRALSTLGQRVIRRIADKGMMFDPDHMSVLARNAALDLVEKLEYPGVMTSHSWSTDNALPRIAALGGLIGPSAKSPEGFVGKWNHIRQHGYDQMNPYGFAIGFGSDMNGFASQGGRPTDTTITYPFESVIDPGVMIDRQVSEQKTFDYNVDGTAHYGLYPDWAKAVSQIGGPDMAGDLARGAEAYLQMWERSVETADSIGTDPPSDDKDKPGTATGAAAASRCAVLRAQLKQSKSKKAKRKLRGKLRKNGCLPKKKKRAPAR